MTRGLPRMLFCLAVFALAALPASAGTVSGTVRNGTTGRVAAGVDVILIQLNGSMQAVATTKTDAQGHYSLESPDLGRQPMLLRAVYRGVNYHQPVPPGQAGASIDVEVFEPTTDPAAFHVLHHIIAVEPQGSSLVIGEEYDIENQTNPPRAYYKADGCFEFRIPAGSQLNKVEAWGPSGMPVVQGAVEKGNNTYAIVFPFRPGRNGVRFSFQLAYSANKASLSLPSMYPVETAMLLAPPAVQVTADGFAAAGNEHGWDVYTRQNIAAGAALAISFSGAGSIPSDTGDREQASGGQGDQGGDAASGVAPVAQALPPRLDSLRWILIAGFASLFLLGGLSLWWRSRRPALGATGPAADSSAAVAGAPRAVALPARAITSPAASESPAGVERDLRLSVDEIKEVLFRLELRHQAGTISEEEYQAQRKRAENALRDLVRG